MICGRRAEVLEATAAELDLPHVAGDVREDADAERILGFALERLGRLDVLVNNAGGQYFTPAEAIEPKGWRAVTRLNVGATERMTRLAAERAFGRPDGGTVVNVTLSPHHGFAGDGALHRRARRGRGLHARARGRVGDRGIAVVAVAAGHYDTASLRKYPEMVWRAARAHRPAPAARAASRSTPGSSRSAARRSAPRSPARSSRSTARATTGSARGRPPRSRATTARSRPRRAGPRRS